ncbi:CPBP family intramembrane metalloprotease [Treponema sp. OttesenSCG-928-L16]|nr:CPBP family intramembrane metalloprotease [Treponema sp. OttesenSCG-928-L16]
MYLKYIPVLKYCQKERTITAILEAVILFFVLFFPGIAQISALPEMIPFSAAAEINRLVLRTIPAFALVWYLFIRGPEKKERLALLKPSLKDVKPLFTSLLGLLALAFAVGVLSNLLPLHPAALRFESPRGFLPWAAAILSCLATGYLEESYFRAYLLRRLEEGGISVKRAGLISALLFSLCHLYEGPWGFMNALGAGFFLALMFIKTGSLTGLAWAHGLYNLSVYALNQAIK